MARFTLIDEEATKAPETGLGSGVRNVARTAARAGEAILGAPGDILSGALGLGDIASQKLLGQRLLPEAQKYIPTSEKIRQYGTEQIGKLLPEGYLQPQGETEEQSDQFFSTLASLASPLAGPLKVGGKVALKLAGAGQLGSFAAKQLGASEGTQEAVKAGTMLATSFWGLPKAVDKAKQLYALADEGLSDVASVSGKPLKSALTNIEKTVELGHLGASEKEALEFIRSVSDKINPRTGEIPLKSLRALKENLNELVFKSPTPSSSKAAQKYLRPLKEALHETIQASAKEHPQFAHSLMEADQLWSAISQQRKLTDLVKGSSRLKNLFSNFKNPGTIALLGGGSLAHALGVPLGGLAAATSAIGAGQLGYKTAQLLATNPAIRNHYIKTMNAAISQNATQLFKNARALDNALSQEENSEESSEGRFKLLD